MINPTVEDIREITDWVANKAATIFDQCKFSTGCKSRIISEMLEEAVANYYKGERAQSDRDPDVYFPKTDTVLEIKVTRMQNNPPKNIKFMGGGYSKRSGQYLLFMWSENEQNLFSEHKKDRFSFRYASTVITEEQWTAQDKGTYYAKFYHHPTKDFRIV